MKKTNKKGLYIAIMSVALVITFVASSFLTLAYFGDAIKATSTISLSNPVNVDSAITLSTASMDVVPSQRVVVNATATVKSEGNSTPTPALLRARINVVTTAPSITYDITASSAVNSTTTYWVKSDTDGYFYLMTTNAATGTLYTIDPGTKGQAVPLNIVVNIPRSLTNADSGKDFKVSITFCAVQGIIYDSEGAALSNTILNTRHVFDNVEGTTLQGEYSEKNYTINGNTTFSTSPSPTDPATLTSVGENGGKNLFDSSKVISYSGNGITFNYLSDEDCFVINGKPTRTIATSCQPLNIPVDKNAKYSISTQYVSGTIDRSTSNTTTKYAVAYFGANDDPSQNTNWQTAHLQNYNTASENLSCAKNYITRFWFYINEDITFTNYKVRVQLEKNDVATTYSRHNSIEVQYSNENSANLVNNGNGVLGNNTNFTSFVYVKDATSPTGSAFVKNTGVQNYSQVAEPVPVDTNSKYIYSMYYRTNNTMSNAAYYIGIWFLDANKNRINPDDVSYFANTLTYLTQDVKSGDTVVHLNDTSSYSTTGGANCGLNIYNYSVGGVNYGPGTYTKNKLRFNATTGIDTTANTITLNSAYSGATIPAGTYVSQGRGGGWCYNIFSGMSMPNTWTYGYSYLNGVKNAFSGKTTKSNFVYGTCYVQPFVLRYSAQYDMYITDVQIKKVGETKSIELDAPLRAISDTVYDSIDSSTGKLTRRVGVYTFTGDENWSTYTNTGDGVGYLSAFMSQGNFNKVGNNIAAGTVDQKFVCSHFPYLRSNVGFYGYRHETGMMGYGDGSAAFVFTIPFSVASTDTEWKAWLKAQAAAGTPVVLYYELATPVETTITVPKLTYSSVGYNGYSVISNGAPARIILKDN